MRFAILRFVCSRHYWPYNYHIPRISAMSSDYDELNELLYGKLPGRKEVSSVHRCGSGCCLCLWGRWVDALMRCICSVDMIAATCTHVLSYLWQIYLALYRLWTCPDCRHWLGIAIMHDLFWLNSGICEGDIWVNIAKLCHACICET